MLHIGTKKLGESYSILMVFIHRYLPTNVGLFRSLKASGKIAHTPKKPRVFWNSFDILWPNQNLQCSTAQGLS